MMTDTINEKLLSGWSLLQAKARTYLTISEQVNNISSSTFSSQQIEKLQELINPVRDIKANKSQYLLNQARYLSAEALASQITSFLNDVPRRGAFVVENVDGSLSTFDLDMTQLIKLVDSSGRFKNISATLIKNKFNSVTTLESQVKQEEKIKNALAAYQGSKARLNEFYARANIQAQGGLLMWKNNKRWEKARIANAGILKEGYVAMLMEDFQDGQSSSFTGNIGVPPYYSHALISHFYEKFLSQVTNEGISLKEDVVTQKAQYSVKSEGAALFALIDQTATIICNSKVPLSSGELKDALQEKSYPLVSLVTNKNLDQATKKILQNMKNRFNKMI